MFSKMERLPLPGTSIHIVRPGAQALLPGQPLDQSPPHVSQEGGRKPQRASSLALKILQSPLLPCKIQAAWKWEGESQRNREPTLWAEAMCCCGKDTGFRVPQT